MGMKDEVKAEFEEMLKQAMQVSGGFTNEVLGAVSDCEDDQRPDMEAAGLDEDEQDAMCAIISAKALHDAYVEVLESFDEPARSILKELIAESKPAERPEEEDEDEDGEVEDEEDEAVPARPQQVNGALRTEVHGPKPTTAAAPAAPPLKPPTLKKH